MSFAPLKHPFQKASTAAFPVGFAARIFEYADSVNRLTKGDITEEILGTFRREYSDHMGTLDILPIGTQAVSANMRAVFTIFSIQTNVHHSVFSHTATCDPHSMKNVPNGSENKPPSYGISIRR